ncbi:hypothetical protein GEMRC1_001020 [Eukaryota sp. GEM-RC1]
MEPISDLHLLWDSPTFNNQSITTISLFHVDVYSLFSNFRVSVYEARDVFLSSNVDLFSPLFCSNEATIQDASINGSSVLCESVLVSSHSDAMNLTIIYQDLIIGYVELEVEPFFQDLCYIPNQISLLTSSDFLMTHPLIPELFDRNRCCLITSGNCFIAINSGEQLILQLTDEFHIHSISITVNSSCPVSDGISPITVSNTSLDLWSCDSIPNGFEFALTCSANVTLNHVNNVSLLFLADLLVFEVEFYGYLSRKCVFPVDDFFGITPANDLISIDGNFLFQGESLLQFNDFYPLIHQDFGLKLFDGSLSVAYEFNSTDCYYHLSTLVKTIFPFPPESATLETDLIRVSSNSFDINFVCLDIRGFQVQCGEFLDDLELISTSFKYSSFKFILQSGIRFFLMRSS